MKLRSRLNKVPKLPLTPEILKELRDTARSFVKLDLLYIAAIGTVITLLKLERPEIYEFAVSFDVLGYVLCGLVALDGLGEAALMRQWVRASAGDTNLLPTWFVIRINEAETFAHVIFLVMAVSGVFAYSAGYVESGKHLPSIADVQDQIDGFVSQQSRSPATLDELIAVRPKAKTILLRLAGEPIRYEKTGEKTYRITFAGNDKILGTEDDIELNGEVNLRKILRKYGR